MTGLFRKLLIGVALGILVFIIMGLYADVQSLIESLHTFTWWLIGPVLALTLVNYGLRFIKWHVYLRIIGAHVSLIDSGLVFLSGLSMAITPGKFGELFKAVLLRDRAGVEATKTASVVIAERLTDFIALIVLAASGVVFTRYGMGVLVVSVVGTVVCVAVASSPTLSHAIIRLLARLPYGDRFAPKLEQMVDAMAQLIRPLPLLLTSLLSLLAWFCECVGYYLVLRGLPGVEIDLGTATFVYAFATIFGAVTMLPGGLGVTEGSLIGLTYKVFPVTASRTTATAGAMLIRLCTLWFAVLIGLVALAIHRRTCPVLPVPDQGEQREHSNTPLT